MTHRPLPVLRRFAMRFLDGSPVAPATGATVRFFKQGATVSEAVPSFSGSATVPIYHRGALSVGDVVQVGADTGKTLIVDDIGSGPPTLELTILTGGPFGLDQDVRLVRIQRAGSPPVADPALIYGDPLGSTTGVSSKTLLAADDGWVVGYVREFRFDVTVSGGSDAPWVYPDAEGSWVMR